MLYVVESRRVYLALQVAKSGSIYIIQAGVNVFFTVFLWMYHKISLCKEEGRERSTAGADERHG